MERFADILKADVQKVKARGSMSSGFVARGDGLVFESIHQLREPIGVYVLKAFPKGAEDLSRGSTLIGTKMPHSKQVSYNEGVA